MGVGGPLFIGDLGGMGFPAQLREVEVEPLYPWLLLPSLSFPAGFFLDAIDFYYNLLLRTKHS